MSKIFRSHRFSGFRAKETKNYLMYSLLEIFLVMIGILLALYISDWNEERKDRQEELELLAGLKNNLEMDIGALKHNIKKAKELQAIADTLLVILSSPKDYSNEEFFYYFNPLQDNLYFTTNSGYFDAATSTGKISHIRNNTIREKLFDYYRSVKLNYNDEETRFHYRNKFAQDVLFELIATKEIANILGHNSKLPSLSIQNLSRNKSFYSALLQKIFAFRPQMGSWRNYSAKAESLIEEIEASIDKQ